MIPDTSTEAGQREASVMLAQLCGWEYQHGMAFGGWFFNGERISHSFEHSLNLYEPANMALAWRVLNWANATRFAGGTTLDQRKWWHNFIADLRLLRASDAQMAWLDKILQLAIEAGMCGREGGAWYIDLRLLRQKEE